MPHIECVARARGAHRALILLISPRARFVTAVRTPSAPPPWSCAVLVATLAHYARLHVARDTLVCKTAAQCTCDGSLAYAAVGTDSSPGVSVYHCLYRLLSYVFSEEGTLGWNPFAGERGERARGDVRGGATGPPGGPVPRIMWRRSAWRELGEGDEMYPPWKGDEGATLREPKPGASGSLTGHL